MMCLSGRRWQLCISSGSNNSHPKMQQNERKSFWDGACMSGFGVMSKIRYRELPPAVVYVTQLGIQYRASCADAPIDVTIPTQTIGRGLKKPQILFLRQRLPLGVSQL